MDVYVDISGRNYETNNTFLIELLDYLSIKGIDVKLLNDSMEHLPPNSIVVGDYSYIRTLSEFLNGTSYLISFDRTNSNSMFLYLGKDSNNSGITDMSPTKWDIYVKVDEAPREIFTEIEKILTENKIEIEEELKEISEKPPLPEVIPVKESTPDKDLEEFNEIFKDTIPYMSPKEVEETLKVQQESQEQEETIERYSPRVSYR